MTDMFNTEIQSLIDQFWPNKATSGQIFSVLHACKGHDLNQIKRVINEVDTEHYGNTFPSGKIKKALGKLQRPLPDRIVVFALCEDGRNVTCWHYTNDSEHARNKMRQFLYRHHKNPDEFSFYIGEDNFPAFLKARSDIFNLKNQEKHNRSSGNPVSSILPEPVTQAEPSLMGDADDTTHGEAALASPISTTHLGNEMDDINKARIAEGVRILKGE